MNKLVRIVLVALILGLLASFCFVVSPLYVQPTTAATTTVFYASVKAYWFSQNAVYLTAQTAATAPISFVSQTSLGTAIIGANYNVWRVGLRFDTSGLPDTAVIASATLSAMVYDKHDTVPFDITVCNGTTPILSNPMVAADFGNLLTSTTSFGSVASTTAAYNVFLDIPLNALGIGEINSAGNTEFALRSGTDILANVPATREYIEFADGLFNYKLTIIYTAAPTISTQAATSVTMSTARLNGLVNYDGGESCYVRFQYGLTAGYGIDTAWVSGYTTGSAPYVSISGLSASTLYHFRAQIYNTVVGAGAPANGVDTTFTTGNATAPGGAGFGRPLNLVALPLSSTSVLLNWEKGNLADRTKIQCSTSAFPTDYNDGNTVYFDEYSSVVVDNLTAGTTYYWSAWSFTPGDNTTGVDYWSDYEPTTLDYLLDAPLTSTTVASDNALLFTDEQYYRGCYAHNITAGNEERLIIDYDAATYACTLLTAIAGQVAGDTWYVRLRCDAVCTTLSSVDDWAFPDDSGAFLEPVTTKLTNFPMNEIVTLWCTVTGMDYEDAWVFWGMVIVTIVGVAVALLSESALLTITAVIIIMAGGYFLEIFALWFIILYIVLSVPLGWALAKW